MVFTVLISTGITVSTSVWCGMDQKWMIYQLSGGQRARVALARAIYARADL
jgi:ABC-type dipeptide/oligopeptide/nickel transport system ATPase subunit